MNKIAKETVCMSPKVKGKQGMLFPKACVYMMFSGDLSWLQVIMTRN